MAADKPEVLLIGPPKPVIMKALEPKFNIVQFSDAAKDRDKFFTETAPRIPAFACVATPERVDGAFMGRFPKLEIVSSFGVGYDNIDAAWAGAHGIIVTNTPDVLTEEVADTALGLLLCTVRDLTQAERFVRAGKWARQGYPLSQATLRNRTVGMVGLGRIGQAIARRLEAMQVPVVYHSRRPAAGVSYRHYPKLLDMARDVDVLLVITPGGEETRNLINADVLRALGPDGILINMSRGSVVDEQALIKALQDKTILSAGLDVYLREPEVPAELIAMDHVVLFPHLGSASVATREKMDQLVADNLLAWAAGKPPVTPVAETPYPPKIRPPKQPS
jgi:lactate dehydrogenase-like 2-hydroxyacid dehydrogenase